MFDLVPYLNGPLIAWVLGGIVTISIGIVGMYFRQRRLWWAVYGSEDDDTQPGILKQQEQSHRLILKEINTLEENVDEQFDDLERQMAHRHDELSVTMAKIIENMDEPPEDVDIYGPWRQSDSYNRKRNGDVRWADGYREDQRDD